MQDRYALERFLPSIDDSQDWKLLRGEERDGRTILEFSRPFSSCDIENDLNIHVRRIVYFGRNNIFLALHSSKLFSLQADTSRVVWSYHSHDPSSEEELRSLQHERKGSASLNLLGGLNEDRVEENSGSFTILNENVGEQY